MTGLSPPASSRSSTLSIPTSMVRSQSATPQVPFRKSLSPRASLKCRLLMAQTHSLMPLRKAPCFLTSPPTTSSSEVTLVALLTTSAASRPRHSTTLLSLSDLASSRALRTSSIATPGAKLGVRQATCASPRPTRAKASAVTNLRTGPSLC
jgi:hypothetical protein